MGSPRSRISRRSECPTGRTSQASGHPVGIRDEDAAKELSGSSLDTWIASIRQRDATPHDIDSAAIIDAVREDSDAGLF